MQYESCAGFFREREVTAQIRMTAAQYRAAPAKRRHSTPEAQLHRAVAIYIAMAVPHDAVWTTVGHGGGGRIRGAQLKAMGLRAGWPDVQILWRGSFLGIELKSDTGRVSPAQGETADAIERAGGEVHLARNLDDVGLILRKFFTGPAKRRRST